MCLDIDPDSVIHKHLVNKLYNIDHLTIHASAINTLAELEMLPSFHISLGAPNNTDPNDLWFKDTDIMTIIGDIALANIHISKKDNKKSAWIPLHSNSFHFLPDKVIVHFESYPSLFHDDCPEYPVKMLHISLANLTGNPHDSIARPEDCIIDTITA